MSCATFYFCHLKLNASVICTVLKIKLVFNPFWKHVLLRGGTCSLGLERRGIFAVNINDIPGGLFPPFLALYMWHWPLYILCSDSAFLSKTMKYHCNYLWGDVARLFHTREASTLIHQVQPNSIKFYTARIAFLTMEFHNVAWPIR